MHRVQRDGHHTRARSYGLGRQHTRAWPRLELRPHLTAQVLLSLVGRLQVTAPRNQRSLCGAARVAKATREPSLQFHG